MKDLFVFVIIIFSVSIHAQESEKIFMKENALKLSPFEFINSEFKMVYERYFDDRNYSIGIAPSLQLKEGDKESRIGWEIESTYKKYLTHINKSQRKTFLGAYNYGFYAGVYLSYLNYNEKYNRWINSNESIEFEKEIRAIEGGVVMGIQVDITERIVFDFLLGGGIRYPDIVDSINDYPEIDIYNYNYDVFDVEYKGIKPKIGFDLGITF